jgi:hypothetical protein
MYRTRILVARILLLGSYRSDGTCRSPRRVRVALGKARPDSYVSDRVTWSGALRTD